MYLIKQNPEDFLVEEVPLDFSFSNQGKYEIYLLTKKECNTVSAIKIISSFINSKPRYIGFAGNKDKNAITKQYISIPSIFSKKINKFTHDKISLEFLGRSDYPISLGKLKGNNFKIILRDCLKKPNKINKFVNYYGEQRFSTHNVVIGKNLLQKKFNEALNEIIESGLENKNLLKYLDEKPNDVIGAIQSLPEKILSLFINSYQSYVWNKVASNILEGEKTDSIEFSNQILNISAGNNEYRDIPIIGFETEIEKSIYSKYIYKVLEDEGISQRDFIIPQFPRISASGGYRKLFVNAEALEIKNIDANTYSVSFFLPKGSYATIFLRHLFL